MFTTATVTTSIFIPLEGTVRMPWCGSRTTFWWAIILPSFKCLKNNSLWSGSSNVILLMVTSQSRWILHPIFGLVPKLRSLRCQSRGDWSQRMASLSSECDSNTFVGKEMQHQLSHYFSSLTTDMNRDARNPRVPGAYEQGFFVGVRVNVFLLLAICQFPFVPSQWLLWRKVIKGKCGSSFA